jgi:3-methyladenine DNA glycosylase AlkD
MSEINNILKLLKSKAQFDQLEGMSRFGMRTENRLGVKIPELRKMARDIGRNHDLALDLWKTEIDDARILAGMIDDPKKVTEAQMESWVQDFNSWDVCDQVCMNLFDKTPLAWKKVRDWSTRKEEFVKRAAFALIACLAWHDKKTEDKAFVELLPLIKREATDNRNFVKKAVSWALRHIGKRNPNLHKIALQTAEDIVQIDSKSARWIAKDAIKDLNSDAVKRKLEKKK